MQLLATIEDPARHSTDPRPSRTPGHPGRPATSVFHDRGRSQAARTPRRRLL